MKTEIIKKRKLYFGFLFSSFIYLGLLMILIREPNPFKIDIVSETFSILGALTPALIFFLRKKVSYKNILIIGQFPLFVGFILSIFYQNILYFLIMFPIFILGYLIILPLEKGED